MHTLSMQQTWYHGMKQTWYHGLGPFHSAPVNLALLLSIVGVLGVLATLAAYRLSRSRTTT